MQSSQPPIRPFSLIGIAITMVFAGVFVGVVTNWANSIISSEYFQFVLRWKDVDDLQRAIVAQGIFEGTIFGFLFALAFTLTVGIISKARCPYFRALRYIVAIIVGVLIFWAIGGCIGMGLAEMSPSFFRNTFYNVPTDHGAMLRYAWVGGSIWGTELGGLLSTIIALVLFGTKWKRPLSFAIPTRMTEDDK